MSASVILQHIITKVGEITEAAMKGGGKVCASITQYVITKVGEIMESVMEAVMKGGEKCDICDEDAAYRLCQTHLDDMRYLETFKTVDGDYPDPGVMVLWDDGSEIFIGGYDPEVGWFSQDDSDGGDEYPAGVTWCLLPNLEQMYYAGHTKFMNLR